MIPVFKPSLSKKEIRAVIETLKSGWWGSGPKAEEFEKKFADFIGVKNAVALNSCTAALHLTGKLLGLKKGDEVITTPLTFISTAYIADYCDAKIVFADVDENTLNIDPEDIKKKISKKTKVIVPVHFGGYACEMDEIMKIANKNKIYVVEDCAHATGGEYRGKKLGSFGTISCFSFQAVKNLAIGDGGMLLTNNDDFAKRAKWLRWTGINKETASRTKEDRYSWEYDIVEVGYKFQMPDILAAIGMVQLERIKELNGRRREITNMYNDAFSRIDWVELREEKPYINSANHNYVIKIDKDREKFMQYMKSKGISTGVHYKPLYLQTVYKWARKKANCPITDKVWKKLVTLPLYPDMTDREVNLVVDAVKKFD